MFYKHLWRLPLPLKTARLHRQDRHSARQRQTLPSTLSSVDKTHKLCCCIAHTRGSYACSVGSTSPFGIEGWRFAFLSVALVSIAIGIGNFMFAHDPRFPPGQDKVLLLEHAICPEDESV